MVVAVGRAGAAVARVRRANPALVIGLGSLALYSVFLFPAMPPVGDAADYAALVSHGEFHIRTCHIGYYVFAFPVVRLASLLHVQPTIALNLFAALCMAAAVGISFLLFMTLSVGRRTAALGSVVLGFTGLFWYHAEFAEVQALLMLAIVASWTLYRLERPTAAGAVFAFSLLVSPGAAPSALCFPAFELQDRKWRKLGLFALASLAFFALGVAPVCRDYLWGPRGIVPSMGYYPVKAPLKMQLFSIYRLVENQHIWVVPMLVGLAASLRRSAGVAAFAAALWLGHSWVNLRLGHVDHGMVWMPAYFGTSLLAALGMAGISHRLLATPTARAAAVSVFVAAGAAINGWLYILPSRTAAVDLSRVIDSVHRTTGDSRVAAETYIGFSYVYQLYPQAADVWQSHWVDLPQTPEAWRSLIRSKQPLYVLAFDVPIHPFRRWAFHNPLMLRLLGADACLQYAQEEDDAVAVSRSSLPRQMTLTPVRRWPSGSLWQVHVARPRTSSR